VNRPLVGWALACLGLAMGWLAWGWPGLMLAVSAIVFWLLLQFTRSMRAMRLAADLPVGHIESAVMLQSKLRRGLLMLDVMKLTRSLGRRIDPASDDLWAWVDPGGAEVRITFEDGRCASWELRRPETPPE